MGIHGAPITARHATRFGTIIVAVGVGGGIASTAGMATAQADSVVDKITPNVSVSAGGLGFSSGTARAKTTAGPNLAIAIGKNAKAEASNGIGNSAVVIGNRSTGTAANGDFNRVRINGDDNTGYAGDGANNVVSVKGSRNTVQASGGDNNRATVTGAENQVRTGCSRISAANEYGKCGSGRHSDNNSAQVVGDLNWVGAGGVESQSALLDADFDGSDNSVTVTGDRNYTAGFGQRNAAGLTGDDNRVVTLAMPGVPFAGYADTDVTVSGNDQWVPVTEDGFTYP